MAPRNNVLVRYDGADFGEFIVVYRYSLIKASAGSNGYDCRTAERNGFVGDYKETLEFLHET